VGCAPTHPFKHVAPCVHQNAILHFLVLILNLTVITNYRSIFKGLETYFVLMTSAYSQFLKDSSCKQYLPVIASYNLRFRSMLILKVCQVCDPHLKSCPTLISRSKMLEPPLSNIRTACSPQIDYD